MQSYSTSAKLDDENSEIINEINNLLADKTSSSRTIVIKALAAFRAERLYILSQNSPDILKLCEDEKESKELNEKLAQSYHYSSLHRLPTGNVVSVDGKMKVTPFQQFMGYHLACKATDAKDSKSAAVLLDQACDKYSNYQALFMRMELALKTIKAAPKKDIKNLVEVNEVIEQLLADAEKIGNLYYSIGYFKAAEVLQAATTAYLDYFKSEGVKVVEETYSVDSSGAQVRGEIASPKKVKLPEIIAVRDKLIEKMLINFYLAYASSKIDTSIKLNLAVNHGDSLLKGLDRFFVGWEGGDAFLKKLLPSVASDSRALFNNVRKSVDAQVNSYPLAFNKIF